MSYQSYKNKIPIILIYSRAILGIAIIILSYLKSAHFRTIIVFLITIGLVTDILDGIIARRLNISSEKLRRLDSSIDQFFWILVIVAAYITASSFFIHNYLKIISLIILEVLAYTISYIRFRKEVATHAILSKIWTLLLFAFLLQLFLTGNSHLLFTLCFYIGIFTRLEIIAILLIINGWTNDIPTVYHAILIRQGKEIKRNKWFNG